MSEAPLYSHVLSRRHYTHATPLGAHMTTEGPVCVNIEYRGTSPTRKRTLLGPYRRPILRFLRGSQGGGRFLMGEVPL